MSAETKFLAEVERMGHWVSTTSAENEWVSGEGEWESCYPDWPLLSSAWAYLLATRPVAGWSPELIVSSLFAIARNDEIQKLMYLLADSGCDGVILLAQHAIDSPETNARWQLANALFLHRLPYYNEKCRSPSHLQLVESLLERFTEDSDEYVRRRAKFHLQEWRDLGPKAI